jgi:hypothetical protein
MGNIIFNRAKEEFLRGYDSNELFGLKTFDIYCALCKNTLVPIPSMELGSEVIEHECSGTNYTSGGIIVLGKTFTHEDENNKGIFDLDDIIFPNITITDVKWAIFYCSFLSTLFEDGIMIGAWDLGTILSPEGVDFGIKINAGGLLTCSQGT